ncbi:hypothetical protein SAMN05660909_01620 [Chitinophaga terrae (ex Kim and Jung 2007)]|uniref:Uncharacterized protein n=1 Tax=Chitinophaga terrae (ex Kim and Jung 2007) TaxID=408074 RepID=A0A1H4AKF7_9BACT|nr:hypothetical protein SAMN05660909_01620 [Chitinophaga terrae (ex Kim and Jung 2007)]
MLEEKRSHCGLGRQKDAPVLRLPFRCATGLRYVLSRFLRSLRPLFVQLPVWLWAVLNRGRFNARRPTWPSIFDLLSAGAPGEIEDEGAACCSSPSLGPSAALQGLRSGCRRSGQVGNGGGDGSEAADKRLLQ